MACRNKIGLENKRFPCYAIYYLRCRALRAIKMSSPNRPLPDSRWELLRFDCLAAAVFSALVFSYVLGYRLDWAEAPSGMEFSSSEETAADPEPSGESELAAEAANQAAQSLEQSAAASGPSWSPDPKEASWAAMTGELERLAVRHRGRVAIHLKDMKTGKTWTYHPDDLFPSASLIKVPIMACAFQKIHEGRLSLNDNLTLRRRHRVGGSGSLKWRPDGTRIKVRDLLSMMINESDNTATAIVIEVLGLSYIQQQFAKMGLFYTEIYPEGMSIKGGRVANENYTTAQEMATLMERIYRGEMVDRYSSRIMMDILRHKRAATSRLAKNLPRGWEIAHKTGLLRQACHDSALIITPDRVYSLTVLTGQNRNYGTAKEFISRLGRITYRHYRGDNALAKAAKRQSLALR